MSRRPVQHLLATRLAPVLGVALAAIFVVTACASTSEDSAAAGPAVQREVPGIEFDAIDDALSIGVFVDLTGPAAAADIELLRGVQAEVALVNQAGGIHGTPLALATYDSHGDVADALVAYRRMRNIDTAFVIVGCDAEVAQALSTRSADDASLVIAACPSSSTSEAAEQTFDLGLAPSSMGQALAAVAIASDWKSIVVASDFADASARRQCDAASSVLADAGRVVAARYDLSTELETLAADLLDPVVGVDGILVCTAATGADEVAKVVRTAGEVPLVFSAHGAAALLAPDAQPPLDIAIVTPVVAAVDELLAASGIAAVEVLVAALTGVDGEPVVESVAGVLAASESVDTAVGPVDFDAQSGRRSAAELALLKTTGFGPLVLGTWTQGDVAVSWSGTVPGNP